MSGGTTRGTTGAPFQYAVVRAVPRVERGECVNVGIVLYRHATAAVDAVVVAGIHLDEARLRALDPEVDLESVRAALDGIRAVCDQGRLPVGDTDQPTWTAGERFGWLTAPRSTVVQTGPVHSGLTDDPVRTLDRLLTRLVL